MIKKKKKKKKKKRLPKFKSKTQVSPKIQKPRFYKSLGFKKIKNCLNPELQQRNRKTENLFYSQNYKDWFNNEQNDNILNDLQDQFGPKLLD